MKIHPFLPIVSLIIALIGHSVDSRAKAFCALRDPVTKIYQHFPQADSYRSLVRTIDNDVRQQVIARLPGLQLHIDELGRHTLYVVLKQGIAIGMIHVRSEQSRWGLIEIVWALDLNLTVLDFSFQRSRAMNHNVVQKQAFKQMLVGENFNTLSQYLRDDGRLSHQAFKQQAQGAEELAMAILASALKTLLVTQLAWSYEVTQLTMKHRR